MAQIPLILPDTSGTEGDTVRVPITVEADLTGEDVLAYEIALDFQGGRLSVHDVVTDGTLSDGFGSVEFSVENAGSSSATLRIAAAGSSPLSGQGALVAVAFVLDRDGTASLSFDADRTQFNEGSPVLDLSDTGSIDSAERPTIRVSPDNAEVLRGETASFSASDGTAPYTWSVTRPSVASIDASGTLTGEAVGTTRVAAVDDNGIRDTSGAVRVRGYRLSLSDTSAFAGSTLEIPVRTTDLSGLGVTAGQFQIDGFRTDKFALEGVETTGTLLEGGSVQAGAVKNNAFDVAFASETTLTGNGELLRLVVRVKEDATGSSDLSVENVLFNESLAGLGNGGRLTADPLPSLSITPNGGTLLAGASVDLSVDGATGPISWSVSDETRAEITSSGQFTALNGGRVTATATDSLGATATTQPFSIADVTLSFPDTTVRVNSTLRLPLRIGNLPVDPDPTALQMEIRYPSSLLSVTGIDAGGTRTDGWSYSTNDDGSVLTIAGAGAQPVTTDGDFLILTVETADLPDEQSGLLEIESVTLNEGTPTAQTNDGTVTVTARDPTPPEFITLPPTRLESGPPYEATVEAQDSGGGAVTLSAPTRPSWLTITDNGDGTATLTGTPPENGFYDLTLSVSDGENEVQESLTLSAYSLLDSVVLSAGDPTSQTYPDAGLEVDLTSLNQEHTLFVGAQQPPASALPLPDGQGLAIRTLWTLDLDDAATFAADVCVNVTTLVNDVAVSTIDLRTRGTPSDSWSAPLPVERRPTQTDPTQLCATDLGSFSSFVVTAAMEDLPVELVDLSARQDGGMMHLTWTTASETNNAGFRIQRQSEGRGERGAWTDVGFVKGSGTTSGTNSYRFTDADLPYAADTLRYRLQQIDTDGTTSFSTPVLVTRGHVEAVDLLGTAPNPARHRTTVRVAVPENTEEHEVHLSLYDVLGRQVQTLRSEVEGGRHALQLDVSDHASGVYVLRLVVGRTVKTQKLVLAR